MNGEKSEIQQQKMQTGLVDFNNFANNFNMEDIEDKTQSDKNSDNKVDIESLKNDCNNVVQYFNEVKQNYKAENTEKINNINDIICQIMENINAKNVTTTDVDNLKKAEELINEIVKEIYPFGGMAGEGIWAPDDLDEELWNNFNHIDKINENSIKPIEFPTQPKLQNVQVDNGASDQNDQIQQLNKENKILLQNLQIYKQNAINVAHANEQLEQKINEISYQNHEMQNMVAQQQIVLQKQQLELVNKNLQEQENKELQQLIDEYKTELNELQNTHNQLQYAHTKNIEQINILNYKIAQQNEELQNQLKIGNYYQQQISNNEKTIVQLKNQVQQQKNALLNQEQQMQKINDMYLQLQQQVQKYKSTESITDGY